MSSPLDLVTLQQAFEYLDLEPDGDELTRKVQQFITAASLLIDRTRGPILARRVAPIDAGTGTTFDVASSASSAELLDLYRFCGVHVSIGTDADPWATARRVRVLEVANDETTVRIDQETTVPAGSGLYVGRHLAADVPDSVRLACLITLRNRWQYEVAAVSQTYDNPAGGTPYALPMAAADLLADYPPAGLA